MLFASDNTDLLDPKASLVVPLHRAGWIAMMETIVPTITLSQICFGSEGTEGGGGKKEKMKSMTKPTSRWLGPRRGTKVCGCVHLRRRGSNFTLSLHNSGCEYNTRGAFLLHPDWIDRSRQLVARATYNRVNFRFCRLIFPSPPLLPPSLILR